jgi:hypothetical protein
MTSTLGPDSPPSNAGLSRRSLLAGAGGLLVLAACGKTDTSNVGAAGSTTIAKPSTLNLQARFDQNEYAVAGIEQRCVVSLLDNSGVTPANAPRSIDVTVTKNGQPFGTPIRVDAHSDGVPVPYFPVRFTPDTPGTYAFTAAAQGATIPATFKVLTATQIPYPQVGKSMIVADSPTTTDARGVDPICTRAKGQCPLHTVNLRDALASGKPTALLVSTPAFCQIGVCGPVLELVLEQVAAHPNVSFIHAEVYKKPTGASDPSAAGLAPLVDAYGLNFEPVMFFAGGDGIVRARLENVFDRPEITAALATLN